MLNNLNILYVEDDKEFNKQLTHLLNSFSINVISAYTGIEGLELYKKHKPDIVISDIQMPQMDGLEMSKKIKEINPNQQIIILSAFDFNDYFLQAIDIGIFAYVLKPIEFDKFLAQLKRCANYIQLEKENKKHQEVLEYNEKYLNSIFNASKDIIITSDGRTIEKANSSMYNFTGFENLNQFKEKYDCICDMFEKKEGYIYGKTIEKKSWVEHILSTPEIYHKAIIKKENEEFIFGINAVKLDFLEYSRYLVILSDITKLIAQENIIKEKEDMLISQSRQASMGELIGMIAHQWKQPLSVISITANTHLADIALDFDIETEQIKEDAYTMLDQVKYLSDTIDDFRDFLKPNREKDSKTINQIIAKATSIIDKALYNNDISLTKLIEEDLTVTTYTKELVQVIINVINNSKDAFIEKDVKNKKIYIKTEKIDDFVDIIIEDNAGGIDPNITEKIFDPYFTTKSEDEGTGIGLYMSKNIIQKHIKGSIKAFNNDKGGLTTVISIPL